MNKRLILGLMIVLGVFTTSLMAAEFEAPKIPSETLTESDLKLIDDAISSDFKGLSKADKKKLKGFLKDYQNSVKRPKIKDNKKAKDKKLHNKSKGIRRYKGGSIRPGN
tara:strand:+ start:345 stop:671 length:327 start_codon:yes stop_codon:yes gene_type:complete